MVNRGIQLHPGGGCHYCSCFYEFYFQIPESTQRGGNILRLPLPRRLTDCGVARHQLLPLDAFQTGVHKTSTMIKGQHSIIKTADLISVGQLFTEIISKPNSTGKWFPFYALGCPSPNTPFSVQRGERKDDIHSTGKNFGWALDG